MCSWPVVTDYIAAGCRVVAWPLGSLHGKVEKPVSTWPLGNLCFHVVSNYKGLDVLAARSPVLSFGQEGLLALLFLASPQFFCCGATKFKLNKGQNSLLILKPGCLCPSLHERHSVCVSRIYMGILLYAHAEKHSTWAHTTF